MNKATRMLAIAGMALAAGATVGIGASPAMAASSSTGSSTHSASQARPADRIVGFYRSYGICDRIGDIGEWQGRWDDHDCYRLGGGSRRGWYALSVSYDWNNGNNHRGHNDWH